MARRADGSSVPGPHGLAYPVYTAAARQKCCAASGVRSTCGAADTWLSFLLQRQNDWGSQGRRRTPSTAAGATRTARREKAAAGQTADPAALPNLSATAFGLEALRAAGRPGDDPAFGRAMHFVCNCHNFADDPAGRDPAFDDGGFFFVLGEAAQQGRRRGDRPPRPRALCLLRQHDRRRPAPFLPAAHHARRRV